MNKEDFRLLHHKAANLNEDVMNRYYGIKANKNAPVRLDEVTLNRILDKHGKNGLIAVSANRSDKDEKTNVRNTQSLINDLKNSGYSYLPTYGGYRGTNGVEDSYEPSFVVFNYDVNGEPTDFKGLYEFALEICKKYERDSVLVKYPNQPPIYVDADGNKVNRTYDNQFECYVNPMPCQLTEMMRRNGEVMIWE